MKLKRVLLVDDSMIARIGIRSALEDMDIEIFEGTNGQEGVELFELHRPDLTFLDLTMPVMDGFQALDEILTINHKACVVVVTADIQKKTLERVLSMGARAVLKKPPVRDEVRRTIQELCGMEL